MMSIFGTPSIGIPLVGRAIAASVLFAEDTKLPDGLIPPVSHQFWVLIIGLLVVAFCVFRFGKLTLEIFVEQRNAFRQRKLLQKRPSRRALRNNHFRNLDEIEQLFKDGKLNEDQVYQGASAVVRSYATGRLNQPISLMTLQEVKDVEGTYVLTQALTELYNLEFDNRDLMEAYSKPLDMIAYIRKLIRRW